ncbi:hypothetical protein HYX17_01195 [Candidatus Woesearchaeota archaeon]|nr:hypothetical protein [Candidatus Woesearchaeota archaeon]
MVTSIQIHEKLKYELDILKSKNRESYEDVILRLIHSFEKQRRSQSKLLVEGYKETAEEDLKQVKEWSTAELDLDYNEH